MAPRNRVLHVAVRFPEISPPGTGGAAKANKFSLIVFAPGYRQCSASYSVLLRQWASAGYVVAAVNFPRTNCHVASPDVRIWSTSGLIWRSSSGSSIGCPGSSTDGWPV